MGRDEGYSHPIPWWGSRVVVGCNPSPMLMKFQSITDEIVVRRDPLKLVTKCHHAHQRSIL